MKKLYLFGKEILRWGSEDLKVKDTDIRKPLPPGRVSVPEVEGALTFLNAGLDVISPAFNNQVIPVIRSLCYTNPDLSQALDNIVQLCNTGHDVDFDASVNSDEANKMRQYLNDRKLEWSESTAGMDGLVNKMVAQVMIGGALSGEWVPQNDLKGISRFVFVNPESITFVLNKATQKYEPYQRPLKLLPTSADLESGLIKLNVSTYKYYALNGDTELPYGIPPYLAALSALDRQKEMQDNIDFIIAQIGLMGFLAVSLDKPDKDDAENEPAYISRLESYLTTVKERFRGGFKDGIVLGYKDDTEFEFHSIAKDLQGALEMFNSNELQVASGMKQDASLLGRSYGTTETQITVIFTKLLSQLKNIQNIIKRNLEFGYTLDLRLAGFDFKSLQVKFNQSTVLDELKYQQALEIKLRNYRGLFYDGIIDIDEYAHQVGYDRANQREVRYVQSNVMTPEEAKAKAKREADKNKSDKKVRDKNRPQERKSS